VGRGSAGLSGMAEIDPEFSRRYRLDALGAGDRAVKIEADRAERAALARRFGLLSLEMLSAEGVVKTENQGIIVRGKMLASGTQPCAVTGDPARFALGELFAVGFIAEDEPENGVEIELSPDDCDTVAHDGNAVDVGEAVAQTLGLALPPFPRSPNADAALRAAGVISDGEAGPFGALAALRDKMTKGKT
jgi:uncharacterized metal-binding protein YceD (DUF177 family)